MKTNLVASFALVVGLLAVCGSLSAHHGETAYNMDHPVMVKDCTVTRLMWTNPHTFVMCDGADEKGTMQHWAAEGGSPNALTLRGWTQTTVIAGDVITLYLFQSKTGKPVGRINKIVLADGKEFRDSILGYTAGEGKGAEKAPDATK